MVLRSDKIGALNGSPAGSGRLPSLYFDSITAQAANVAWRDFISSLFDFLAADRSGGTLNANFTARHFGTFLLCKSFVERGRHIRDGLQLARDDRDHIVISCIISGRIALPPGRERFLHAGDVTVLDLLAPARFSMAATEALHVVVPRVALPAAVAPAYAMPLRAFARGSAMAIFIRGVMQSLWDASEYLEAAEVSDFGSAMIEMLSWCLCNAVPVMAADRKADLGRRLRRHIEQNLHRADLGPQRLLREVGVSRSQLYRLFQNHGGVEAYIRRRRLRRSLIALNDPRHVGRRISDIAYDAGFADEAHFSRLFRQAFEQSPRDARNAAGVVPGAVPSDPSHALSVTASLAHWLSTLGTS